MPEPRPIILCGKTEQIAATVIDEFKPEYEVIHLILTPEAGRSQIPAILRGETVVSDSRLGSQDYAQDPVAVVTGAGYDEAAVEGMMKASEGIKPLPWLRPDTTKPAPPLGPEYGKAMVQRAKDCLRQTLRERDTHRMDVYWY